MGFPVGSELLFPRLLLNAVFLLGFLRSAICWVLGYMGLGEFLEPETRDDRLEGIRESFPVVTFCVLTEGDGEEDVVCSVCLNELKREEEIRRLSKCGHIFHRGCVDEWLDHGHKTCPLCRSTVLSDGNDRNNNVQLFHLSFHNASTVSSVIS